MQKINFYSKIIKILHKNDNKSFDLQITENDNKLVIAKNRKSINQLKTNNGDNYAED